MVTQTKLKQEQNNGSDFCSIYQAKHVTPYAHAFTMHVPEFVGIHGNISKFCQQGLEKLNDVTTLHNLRGTNHKGSTCTDAAKEKSIRGP